MFALKTAHRFIKKQLLILILALSITTTAGLSIQERLQTIEENFIEMKNVWEEKVIKLEDRVKHLEEKIGRLEAKINEVSQPIASQRGEVKTVHRSCSEISESNSSLTSGMYWIDPDGLGVGDDPIFVYCDIVEGLTSIMHDSESQMDVVHCGDPGCHFRTINYNATMRQMQALASVSKECRQTIRYDCESAPFEVNNVAYSWWNDRDGNPQYFWSGSDNSTHTCQCGIDPDGPTCFESNIFKCNCDSNQQIRLFDKGTINNKNLLPVTRLNFGRTLLPTSKGLYTLGRFECIGATTLSRMPTSCMDLLWMGNRLSGLYSVMGDKSIETVFCDFKKSPENPNFQTWIGFTDVKSQPTYFYVQKKFWHFERGSPIPFEIERLNVGGAMNISSGIFTAPRNGQYFFSLSGIAVFHANNKAIIGLKLNGNPIGHAHSQRDDPMDKAAGQFDTFTLQSLLHLNKGDQIWLYMYPLGAAPLFDDALHYTHFTGMLLEENISKSLITM